MSTNTAAGKTIHNDKVKNLVITAFFTAITFLGIQSFRIPLPAAVGTPFLHFGHIFVVMGLLLQGGKRGAVSGTLGLTINRIHPSNDIFDHRSGKRISYSIWFTVDPADLTVEWIHKKTSRYIQNVNCIRNEKKV